MAITVSSVLRAWCRALEERGDGRVLVVDTGGSMRCAVLGDNLAAMGAKNGWSVRVPNSANARLSVYAVFEYMNWIHFQWICQATAA